MKARLRYFLRLGITLVLRLRSRRYSPASGCRCVVIAPHQDDEAFGCAGLILAHRSANSPVSVVYITDGSASHPQHSRINPANMAFLRRDEAGRAMESLGVSPSFLHFMNAADGTLSNLEFAVAEDLLKRLASTLTSLAPTELFIPCRDDGSSEHIAAFQLVQRALRLANLQPRILEYPVWARWSPLLFARTCLVRGRVWRHTFPHALKMKRNALAAYVSQTEPTPPWTRPVLPPDFVRCFESSEEFFFEIPVLDSNIRH